jgi:hypothetical protein
MNSAGLAGTNVFQDLVLGEMIENCLLLARSERFELPTLGFEVRCSIQLSYERVSRAP